MLVEGRFEGGEVEFEEDGVPDAVAMLLARRACRVLDNAAAAEGRDLAMATGVNMGSMSGTAEEGFASGANRRRRRARGREAWRGRSRTPAARSGSTDALRAQTPPSPVSGQMPPRMRSSRVFLDRRPHAYKVRWWERVLRVPE